MTYHVDLKAKPFNLTEEQVSWVESEISRMTVEEKLGQLFLPLAVAPAEEEIAKYDMIGLKPGGVLLRADTAENIRRKISLYQEHAEIPLLIAGDLDRGSWNMISDGTQYGHEMLLAASGDPQMAYRGARILGEECSAVGATWNFGPVVDIDLNPFNPVTNVRTFGSDPERVLAFALASCRGMRESGVLPCAKHFPGDGVDGRDQHFLSSVNSLSVEEWDATYGKIYQALIDDGLETIMTAHIMQPAYTRKFSPDTPDEDILPASLSRELNIRLLREKLGFNGLLVTDASGMAGFTDVLPRSVAVPTAIAHGADIFLFSRDLGEDFDSMKAGLEKGILTEDRLNEAVARILGMKAKLRLPEKKAAGTLTPPESALEVFRRPESAAFAKEAADRGITLVKDTQHLLPLSPDRQKRLFVIPIKVEPNYHNPIGGYEHRFVKDLESRGFEVHLYDSSADDMYTIGKLPIREFRQKYDAIIYFMNVASSSSDSAVRISWPGTRVTITMMIHDVPNLMVSIDNPYHLMDAPRIPTYVNAYNSSDLVVDTLVEKLTGDSPFRGVSPMDPFVRRLFFNTDK
jgi:beta-N-acetylhexosaminidase